MSYYRDQLEDWLSKLEVDAYRVLDIGGGANSVKGRVKSWKVKEYYILDNKQESMKEAVDIYGDINYPIPQDLRNAAIANDAIFCLEVFEYIWNPVQALMNIHDLLKPGGTLYITFPFVYPIHQPVLNDYLRYTRSGIYKLLSETGFDLHTIDVQERVDRSNVLRSFYQADGMHPAKGFNHSVTGYLVSIKI